MAFLNSDEPFCCFDVEITNQLPNTFTDLKITPLTSLTFDNVVYTPGWTASSSTSNLIQLSPASGFIPGGTSQPISICIANFNTIPQQILVELFTPNGEVCEKVIYMDCQVNTDVCPDNLVQNGDFESGIASSNDQDIANATGWSGIWTGGSLADFYNTTSTTIPWSLTMPQPASQSNFAGFWCRNHPDETWREGIMNTLNTTIMPNTGCYDVTLKVACMFDVSGTPGLSLYGVPVGAAGVSNPGGNTPTNDNLFTPQAVELHIESIPATCDENFQVYTFSFDSSLVPAGGIDRVFLTRTDGMSGLTFLAVDDVCIIPGDCCDDVDWSTLNYGIMQDNAEDCMVKVYPIGNGIIPPLVYDWYDVDWNDDGTIEHPGVGSTDTTYVVTNGGWVNIKITAYKVIGGDTCSHEYVLEMEMPPCDPVCENNLVQNGDFETGTPTSGDQDIANASFWNPVWTGGSTADYYNTTSTTIPWSLTMPQPASQGSFGGIWCRNHPDETWREGLMNTLNATIVPNSGCYDVTLKIACMYAVSGSPGLSIYGVPVGATGVSNPGGNSPTNDNLFTPVAVELGSIAIDASCDENFFTVTFQFDSNILTSGIDRVFLTRSDNASGTTYLAIDDVCIAPGVCETVCEGNLAENGDFETGTPTSGDQDIANASFWNPVWTGGSTADYYNTTTTTIPWSLTMPQPASQGSFGGIWCRNHPDETWREGLMNTLGATIVPNTGCYDVTFKIACMYAVSGSPGLSVYGVPVGATGVSNPGGNSPTNDNLFTPVAVELGSIAIDGSCDENFFTVTFQFDSNILTSGIDRVFLTRSDNASGTTYLAIDDLCIVSGACDQLSAVGEVEQPLLFKVQPTVTDNMVTVIIDDFANMDYEMELFDVNGRPVMAGTRIRGVVTELSLSELPSGMYLVRIRTENGMVGIKRVIKQ